MSKKHLLLLALIIPLFGFGQDKFTISGNVRDAKTGEDLIGATVFIESIGRGTMTNLYGFYSFTLEPGTYDVKFGYIGFNYEYKTVVLDGDVKLDIELTPSNIELEEATVEAKKPELQNVESVEMSKVTMQMESIKKIPAFLGEVDVIKAIQLLPGVQTVGEGGSGFYVRGGAVDQNLILLDESPVYNASHLLGFFSVFNSDAIKDLQLYKGGIPARYGGRLSSVLDIRMKDGNKKEFGGTGGIGTISSRLTLEGPIVKDKGSFLVSGRRTYADAFLRLSSDEGLRNTKLYFYDLNLKANYVLGDNDRIYLSGYFGRDVTGFSDLFRIEWGNTTGTLRWNHIFNNKLFSNVTLAYSDFDYLLASSQDDLGFRWDSSIRDLTLKSDYNYFLNPSNQIRFGVSVTRHEMDPGHIRATSDDGLLNELRQPVNTHLESGVYISNEQNFTDQFTAIYGLRLSMFNNVGGTYYNFDDAFNTIDSTVYSNGDIHNTYIGLEPRLGLNYQINESSSVKASYNRMYQYLHLASNSTASSPLDIWFASSPNVKPQRADQWAIGYFRNFRDNSIEASAEIYYKDMNNSIDFKDNAQLLLNDELEGELRFGDARAYGLELFFRKQTGRLTGMVGYTLARTERLIPEINDGWYPTKYDKTHDISVVASYELSKRVSLGATFVYGTGAAVTFPTGRFEYYGTVVPVYGDRNSNRMPAYHRMDVGCTVKGKERPDRKWEGEWVFSIYNVYFRKNAYQIEFRQDENDPTRTEAVKTYLLPILPSFTYNFKF
ncbi:MAG: TonB-dependent receptor [Flavobacteriales bacterium]|nr:TonB-dependent receptor [Flavobacteriales bacterium]